MIKIQCCKLLIIHVVSCINLTFILGHFRYQLFWLPVTFICLFYSLYWLPVIFMESSSTVELLGVTDTSSFLEAPFVTAKMFWGDSVYPLLK